MSWHPNELLWTRALDGALGPLERLRLALHLRRCGRCRTEHQAMRAEQAAYQGSSERAKEVQSIAARVPRAASAREPRRRSLGLGLGLGAAAATALAVVAVRPLESPVELRAKGGDGFELLLKRGDEVSPMPSRCRQGDALRARLRTSRKQVLVVGIDPSGQVSALYPFGGVSSVSAGPGELLTPGSWVLDGAPGHERFVAIFSDEPVALEQAREAIAQASSRPPTLAGATILERSCLKAPP